jgi:hypothetical protein
MRKMVAVGAVMAKKKSLQEVQALDNAKNDYPFATWEVWEASEYFEGLYGDGEYDNRNWDIVAEGALEHCMSAVEELISLELDEERQEDIRRLSAEYDDEPQKFLEELERWHQQRCEDIKKQCWKTGTAAGGSWFIERYVIEGRSKLDETFQHRQRKNIGDRK